MSQRPRAYELKARRYYIRHVQGVTLIEAPALEQSILSSKYKAAEHQLRRAWTFGVDAGQLNKAN